MEAVFAGLRTMTQGWKIVCRSESGQRFDVTLEALDRRLRLGLRGGTWDVQRLLDEIAQAYGVQAEALYNGRPVLRSRVTAAR